MCKSERTTDTATDAQNAYGSPAGPPVHVRVRRFVLLACLMLVAWRMYADRDYWVAALSQQSMQPAIDAKPNVGHTLAAMQGPVPTAFDLSTISVPVAEIFAGGPPKDGIPALSAPTLIEARDAGYLHDGDRVIGVVVNAEARAYPLRILNFHEIVNDDVRNVPIAITYCPLCDSCAVFDRRTGLGRREFGVSGLLYNSNVLMYDRGSRIESLWSQVKAEGISGPALSETLKSLPLELTTWKAWRSRHPQTKVLSADTGHGRDYTRNPYAGYFTTPQLMFPARPTSDRLPTKARVLGIWSGKVARAYPETAFGRDRTRIEDSMNGRKIVIEFLPESASLRVVSADDGVHWMYSLWFAWYAMRPHTDVFTP